MVTLIFLQLGKIGDKTRVLLHIVNLTRLWKKSNKLGLRKQNHRKPNFFFLFSIAESLVQQIPLDMFFIFLWHWNICIIEEKLTEIRGLSMLGWHVQSHISVPIAVVQSTKSKIAAVAILWWWSKCFVVLWLEREREIRRVFIPSNIERLNGTFQIKMEIQINYVF